jgi:hypothetical protein
LIRVEAKNVERVRNELLKFVKILRLAIHLTQARCHLACKDKTCLFPFNVRFPQLEGLRAAKDVTKIYMEKPTTFRDHDVIVVTITNAHQVRCNAVPSKRSSEEQRGVLKLARGWVVKTKKV